VQSEPSHPKRKKQPLYIHACGFNSALGASPELIHQRLRQGASRDMIRGDEFLNADRPTIVGKVTSELPEIKEGRWDSGNNRLALSALQQIAEPVEQVVKRYGAERVAVVAGTSTSGIADGERALFHQMQNGRFPEDYYYEEQEIGNLSEFVASCFGIKGAAYTISTACSSSGRAFISAARLLRSGMADAVIVGGADSLCRLTLNGFQALESLSDTLCNPFSKNRQGINIGEGAAFFILTRDAGEDHIALLGFGDSSDAHHISAPHPEGVGAEEAMRRALDDAGLVPDDIGYINAHGTATVLNDVMEAQAIYRLFGDGVPVSSTKPLTGHTLGAASAVEAAICWHVLRYQLELPVQVNDRQYLDDVPPIRLAESGTHLKKRAMLSNSFAFGGNNVSLIFGIPNE
jgi:3-oxoacyl-[acyl-carrier-protein] synthase-1